MKSVYQSEGNFRLIDLREPSSAMRGAAKTGLIQVVSVFALAVAAAPGGQSTIRVTADGSMACTYSTSDAQLVLADPGWAQIQKALATAEPAGAEMVCVDEELLGRKALEKFLQFRDAIAQRMPHPTSWAITEAGGLTVEQREGTTSHLLRIGRGGKGFLTSFRGQEKIAETLEL